MPKRLLFSIFVLIFLQLTVSAKDIPFHPVPNQPYLQSAPMMIDSEEYNTVILKINSQRSGQANLLWMTSYDKGFDQRKNVQFLVKKGEKNYYLNIPSQNQNWIGWVRGFIFFPAPETKGFQIVSAKAIKGNLISNIASGWQEFWGPKGRVETGSTINLIPGSTIFGRSVNIYIYWIIAIAFFVFLIIYFVKQSDITKACQPAIRSTIIVMIGLWILLTLNADYNYFNLFKNNFSKYFGKSIDEKRAIAYGKEYYNFLVFAKEKLPKEPVKFGILSSKYAPFLQAGIYLVPHMHADHKNEDVLYLLVYYPDAKQKLETKDFKVIEKLNPNAYIMKRKTR